ncbi:MAG TPA: SAM-dependent methyltransferase [Candidatus Mediterraneibacter norfolkensis]|nr:SAM-dependent methyltransferase [Candidatus Mediterraneibacter norfolkensis]
MKEIQSILKSILNIDFIRGTISGPRKKEGIIKIKVRPLERKGTLYFQLESFTKTQAFHENLTPEAAGEKIALYMKEFRQMQAETVNEDVTVLVSKKGKVTIQRKKKKEAAEKADLTHDRRKRHILEEGIPVPFLKDLGVMTEDGKIVRSKTDKFRQINRFLEFIEDILPRLDKGRELTILDFGCGKSYLTFAMYYYLHELKEYDIRIIGLDLKKDVIRHCSSLAVKYGYDKLTFLEGDIADYDGVDQVDMVVTLHACDTATDYALAKAVGWNAKVILSVPCCQHELNGQMKNEILAPVMDYGLLKERFAALATDGLRAKYLEREGYETQVLEFIDMEHTPKNILLRAVKNGERNEKVDIEIKEFEKFLGVHPTLGELLKEKEENDK